MSGPGAWALVVAALIAGWVGYGWPGVVLALTVTAFWMLLQFGRALRTMRVAGRAPVGSVASAVMLHTKLKPGMAMIDVLPLTRSLGVVVGPAEHETYRWTDGGGRSVVLEFRGGRLLRWLLDPEAGSEGGA
ncbi:MAG TPA: hypothetical protein VLI72_09495 [Methylibium sp.]|nr:hypothetical protein [Methylibium sp.]